MHVPIVSEGKNAVEGSLTYVNSRTDNLFRWNRIQNTSNIRSELNWSLKWNLVEFYNSLILATHTGLGFAVNHVHWHDLIWWLKFPKLFAWKNILVRPWISQIRQVTAWIEYLFVGRSESGGASSKTVVFIVKCNVFSSVQLTKKLNWSNFLSSENL
jgi:hypothetical protein